MQLETTLAFKTSPYEHMWSVAYFDEPAFGIDIKVHEAIWTDFNFGHFVFGHFQEVSCVLSQRMVVIIIYITVMDDPLDVG